MEYADVECFFTVTFSLDRNWIGPEVAKVMAPAQRTQKPSEYTVSRAVYWSWWQRNKDKVGETTLPRHHGCRATLTTTGPSGLQVSETPRPAAKQKFR